MTTTVGILVHEERISDPLWAQCDQPFGRHADFEVRGDDPSADHVVIYTSPTPDGFRARPPLRLRMTGGARGSAARKHWRLHETYRRRELDPERTTVMFYEPPTLITDLQYEVAKERARAVYGPDPRAPHRLVLPAMWKLEVPRSVLVSLGPEEPQIPLVTVTSGKRFLPGHVERLEFLARLRRAGVPFELYGVGLPAALEPRGLVWSKAHALRGCRMTLAIENYAEGEQYVTEKLWDPLLMWSLPLYYGSRASDRLIPSEAFVRLPDLGAAGVETVREALARPELWRERLDAMAEARRRILGELRMVEWIRRVVVEGAAARP